MNSQPLTPDALTSEELATLVDVAERSIRLAVLDGRRWLPDPSLYPTALQHRGAAFVTLRKHGRLMGCVGTMVAAEPLVTTVADRARAAAFDDPRFPGITADDLTHLDVSVSVLSPMERVRANSYDDLLAIVRPGVDGLLVEAGGNRATLLPSVWDELPSPTAFVEALWRKAWLAPREWPPGVRVSRYTALEYSHGDLPPVTAEG
jgi:uncharacterized protein